MDYTLKSGTLMIKPGKTVGTIFIPIIDDHVNDPNLTIQVTLTNPGGAFLGGNTVFTYTIIDADPKPSAGFTTTTGSGQETVANVSVPVSLSAASGQVVTLAYAVTGGTAVSGINYVQASGTLTFPRGSKTARIPLTILDGSPLPASQTVQITLSSPTNATLGSKPFFTYTILATPAQVGFDSTPPVILASSITDSSTSGDLTVSGIVTDNFAGVSSLQCDLRREHGRISGCGAGGRFSVDLPLGRRATVMHLLYLTATDRAGNVMSTTQPVPIFDLAPGSDVDTPAIMATTDQRRPCSRAPRRRTQRSRSLERTSRLSPAAAASSSS